MLRVDSDPSTLLRVALSLSKGELRRGMNWQLASAGLSDYYPAMECPLCAETMILETREIISRVPGTSQQIRTVIREWVCRECDYFEETEETGSPKDGAPP